MTDQGDVVRWTRTLNPLQDCSTFGTICLSFVVLSPVLKQANKSVDISD